MSKPVPTKVMLGNVAASKKSGLARWPSRLASRVSTLAVWMVTSRDEAAGSAPLMLAVPVTSLNAPRTLAIIAWRVTKPMRECEGSRL